jgi:cytidylate kinase
MRSWELPKIIGIYGKMHTGKTTLAKKITRDHIMTQKVSFANNVREVVNILNLPNERESYQKVGAGMRAIWHDVWVDAMAPELSSLQSNGIVPVFDDLRYTNEFDFIRKNNGLLVKLTASDDERWARFHTSDKFDPDTTREQWDAYQNHSSETDMDNIPNSEWSLVVDTEVADMEDLPDLIWGLTNG